MSAVANLHRSLDPQTLRRTLEAHRRYLAATRLEFDPADFQQAAGLIFYRDSTKLHPLHVAGGRGACR